MEELISIIVPIYNVRPYLKRCIDSILCQTYTRLEILLVDDGSTDGSGEIADEYALQDKRIKVIHQKNKGLSGARNSGIREADGTYYLFVDSDDYIKEDMVGHLYEILKCHDARIAVCGYTIEDEAGNIQPDVEKLPDEEKTVTEREFWSLYQISNMYSVVVWNKLYHKEIFHNLNFPEGKVYEDAYILHEVMEQNPKIVCSPLRKYCYCKHMSSITNRNNSAYKSDAVEAFFRRLLYFGRKRMYREAHFAFKEAVNYLLLGYDQLLEDDRNNGVRLERWENKLVKAARVFLKKPIPVIFRIRIHIFVTDKRIYRLLKTIRIKQKDWISRSMEADHNER